MAQRLLCLRWPVRRTSSRHCNGRVRVHVSTSMNLSVHLRSARTNSLTACPSTVDNGMHTSLRIQRSAAMVTQCSADIVEEPPAKRFGGCCESIQPRRFAANEYSSITQPVGLPLTLPSSLAWLCAVQRLQWRPRRVAATAPVPLASLTRFFLLSPPSTSQ